MHDEDPITGEAPATPDRNDEDGPHAEQPAEQGPVRKWRPIGGLGGLGCLTLVLAAAAVMALLSTGDFFAMVAGLIIMAVAIGLALWLYNATGGGSSGSGGVR